MFSLGAGEELPHVSWSSPIPPHPAEKLLALRCPPVASEKQMLARLGLPLAEAADLVEDALRFDAHQVWSGQRVVCL